MIPLTPDTIATLVKYDTIAIIFLLLVSFSYIKKLTLKIENTITEKEINNRLNSLEANLQSDIKDLKIRFEQHVNIVNKLMLDVQEVIGELKGKNILAK